MIRIVTDWRGLADDLRGAAVAIGAFDGVHRGHQSVIARAREAAAALNVWASRWASSASIRIRAAFSSPRPRPFA